MAEEYCWAINGWRSGHAAAEQVIVCWRLGSSYTALYQYIRLTQYIINCDLRKVRLAPDIQNVNTTCQRVSTYSWDVKGEPAPRKTGRRHNRNFKEASPRFEQISCTNSERKMRRRTNCSHLPCITEWVYVMAIFQCCALNVCNATVICHLCSFLALQPIVVVFSQPSSGL
jgi:hypothetical protein